MERHENHRKIEYWRWRYRDPESGCICRTTFQLRAEQAAGLMEAERIPGTMSLRDIDDFEDTRPAFFERDALGSIRPAMT